MFAISMLSFAIRRNTRAVSTWCDHSESAVRALNRVTNWTGPLSPRYAGHSPEMTRPLRCNNFGDLPEGNLCSGIGSPFREKSRPPFMAKPATGNGPSL